MDLQPLPNIFSGRGSKNGEIYFAHSKQRNSLSFAENFVECQVSKSRGEPYLFLSNTHDDWLLSVAIYSLTIFCLFNLLCVYFIA